MDPVTGVLQAKFLDVRVGGRVALEAVFVAAEKYGFRGGLSNHGGLGRHHVDAFDVARGAWSEVAGTSLPLQQNLTVSGGFGELRADFEAPPGCYMLLPFPSPDGSNFLDFECLGAKVRAVLRPRPGSDLAAALGGAREFAFAAAAAEEEPASGAGEGGEAAEAAAPEAESAPGAAEAAEPAAEAGAEAAAEPAADAPEGGAAPAEEGESGEAAAEAKPAAE